MSAPIFDKLKTDVDALIAKAKTDVAALAPITPPPVPTSNVYDNYPTTYEITQANPLSPNGKFRLIYNGYNPDNHSIIGHAGVRVPSKVPPDNSPRVYFAYPYLAGYTGTGTNATLTLSEQDFTNFDMTFYMRTVRSLRTNPRNWETAWILFRFSDHFHHYFYEIKRDGGIDFGRKDNTGGIEEQTFFGTGSTMFADGLWNKHRIKAVDNHFTIWINDVQKIDIIDNGTIGTRRQASGQPIAVQPPSAQMAKGKFGPYAEDSESEWGPFTITAI
jgi:hypothetical protein